MTFPVFTQEQFDIFHIPEFAERMAAIRAELRPRLLALGEDLAPLIEDRIGGVILPHTAAHMRRRTNPPLATWAAFGRSPRGYRRYVHFRVAVHAGGLRVTIHVEEDADDKATLATTFARDGERLHASLAHIDSLVWYSLSNGGNEPVTGSALRQSDLTRLSETLAARKTADFSAGFPFDRADPRLSSPDDLRQLLLQCVDNLAPLYRAALPIE